MKDTFVTEYANILSNSTVVTTGAITELQVRWEGPFLLGACLHVIIALIT